MDDYICVLFNVLSCLIPFNRSCVLSSFYPLLVDSRGRCPCRQGRPSRFPGVPVRDGVARRRGGTGRQDHHGSYDSKDNLPLYNWDNTSFSLACFMY